MHINNNFRLKVWNTENGEQGEVEQKSEEPATKIQTLQPNTKAARPASLSPQHCCSWWIQAQLGNINFQSIINNQHQLYPCSQIVHFHVTQVLGAIRTLERLHPKSWLRDSTLTEDSRFEALLSKVGGIDIGSSFSEALPALRSSQAFRARSLRLLGKLPVEKKIGEWQHFCCFRQFEKAQPACDAGPPLPI